MPTLTAPSTPVTNNPIKNDHLPQVEHDLSAAYSDCHRHHLNGYVPERNLHFCSPVTVSVAEAKRLLTRYVPGYNEFTPKVLNALPRACRVRLAREGSVCIYLEVKGVLDPNETRRNLHCDEFALVQMLGKVRTYRAWWD